MKKKIVFLFLGVFISISLSPLCSKAATVTLAGCRDSGDNFYETVTVSSYTSNSSSVCTGQVVSGSDSYSIEFKSESDTSTYSDLAIKASMKTACKVLEEVEARGLGARISGDIYNCKTLMGIASQKIMAENIVVGSDASALSHTNAFVGSTRGDLVTATDSTVEQYLVYSNQAHNHCSPYIVYNDKDFGGLVMVSTSSSRPIGVPPAIKYSAAVNRCNDLLDAYLDALPVDIAGEIYNAPYSSTGDLNADVRITSVN